MIIQRRKAIWITTSFFAKFVNQDIKRLFTSEN